MSSNGVLTATWPNKEVLSMLTVKGLNKSFGENEILKKIDMKIEKGKVIAILGPQVQGKRRCSAA